LNDSVDKLIIGCGYLGSRVAQRWLNNGFRVAGVVRRPEHAEELARQGIVLIVADVTQPSTLDRLPPAATVLCSVGYDSRSETTRQQVYVDGLRAVLDRLSDDVLRIILISSTGVYGSSDGAWIDEDSPCVPSRSSGAALLEAEQLLQSSRFKDRSVILRLAGIYGPGRLPRMVALGANEPVPVAAGHYVNLIHVDDAVTAVMCADAVHAAGRVYNVSDGHPIERREYLAKLSQVFGLPPPIFCQPIDESQASDRRNDNKRICNRRMLEHLGVVLTYAKVEEGLAASKQ